MFFFRDKSKLKISALLLILCVMAISGCQKTQTERDVSVRVTLISSEYYELAEGGSACIVIQAGEDAHFSVIAKSGYYIANTDYAGSSIDCRKNGVTEIILPAVK